MAGEPVYLELGVEDATKARVFYSGLLGWPPADGPGQVSTPTLDIGIHGGDPETHFEVFFAVDDLEVAMETVTRLGGALVGDVHDDPGFGRWIECADDQGVRFGMRRSP